MAEQTTDDFTELLDVLSDVINQACSDPRGSGELDSMALSAYADGLRLLAKHGRVGIVDEYGRRVIAEWVPEAGDEPGTGDE